MLAFQDTQKSTIGCMVWDDWRRSKWKLVFPSDARHSSVPMGRDDWRMFGHFTNPTQNKSKNCSLQPDTMEIIKAFSRREASPLGVWGKAREECHSTSLLHIRCCSFCSLKESKRSSMEMLLEMEKQETQRTHSGQMSILCIELYTHMSILTRLDPSNHLHI